MDLRIIPNVLGHGGLTNDLKYTDLTQKAINDLQGISKDLMGGL